MTEPTKPTKDRPRLIKSPARVARMKSLRRQAKKNGQAHPTARLRDEFGLLPKQRLILRRWVAGESIGHIAKAVNLQPNRISIIIRSVEGQSFIAHMNKTIDDAIADAAIGHMLAGLHLSARIGHAQLRKLGKRGMKMTEAEAEIAGQVNME